MTEKQKKFLDLVNQMMPHMTELEQEKMLAFGEGMAFMRGTVARDQERQEKEPA